MNRDKLYLKTHDSNEYTNSVFEKIKESEDYTIYREIDSITTDEEIKAIKTNIFNEKFYTINKLINRNFFVGETGYFKDMSAIERYIYSTFKILFMDENNLIIQDLITDKIFVQPNIYDTEFVPVIKNNKIKTRKVK